VISYEELGEAFRAQHLAVPMDLAFALDYSLGASEGAALLREKNFDQAPVSRAGDTIGFVLRSRLEGQPEGTVGDLVTRLGPGNIVSANAPIRDLLDWIVGPGFLFVLDGREFSGFVTVSDFNKQPARAYLYLLLATFETGLADLMRRRFSADQEQIFQYLSDEENTEIRDRYLSDRQDNVEADPVAYLGFSQLVNVVTGDVSIQERIGVSRTAWKRDSGSLVKLRNSVMHPARSLVDRKEGLLQLRQREARLRRLSDLVGNALGRYSTEAEGQDR
jgi:hypothetical protein